MEKNIEIIFLDDKFSMLQCLEVGFQGIPVLQIRSLLFPYDII